MRRARARSIFWMGRDRLQNPAQPAAAEAEWKTAVSACGSVVSRTLASWNQIAGWLRQIDGFRVVV
jgi:hypothetical protein